MAELFWVSVFLIVYTYLLYPVILLIASGVRQALSDQRLVWTKANRRVEDAPHLPNVSVLIAAYNEEEVIGQRVENLLSVDYPADKIEFLVGSDGSTDRTAEILDGFDNENVKIHAFERNRGKINVLNDLVSEAQGDILVLSDANTEYEPLTVRRLVRHFEQPKIGAVCGELHLYDPESGENRDSAYWRYEQILKFHESRLGALLGANGAIYAIRRELYEPLPEDTIVDDFQIAMQISRRDYRVHYDPEASASEEAAPSLKSEYHRRVRIGAGNYQAFFRLLWAMNPRRGWQFFSYISHKAIRWFVPHLLLCAFVTNFFLLSEGFYTFTLLAQILFYASAGHGIRMLNKGESLGFLLSLVTFFVYMNFAFMLGFVRYSMGDLTGSWQRTAR